MISELRSEHPHVFVVDVGNSFASKLRDAGASDSSQRQQKASLVVESFVADGLDVWLPGEADFGLGSQWLIDLANSRKLPATASNLACGPAAEIANPLPEYVVVEKGGFKVVFVGILPESKLGEHCRGTAPLAAVLAALNKAPPADFVVALSRLGTEQDTQLAPELPAIDLWIAGGSPAPITEPRALPDAAALLAAGTRGKYVGLVRIEPEPGAKGLKVAGAQQAAQERLERTRERLLEAKKAESEATGAALERATKRRIYLESELHRLEKLASEQAPADQPLHALHHELVSLGESVADEPKTAARVAAFKAASTAAAAEESLPLDAPIPSTSPYVGSSACLACHPSQHAQWSSTAHSHAWQSLVDVQRQSDLACWSCHATGAGLPGGPSRPALVGSLANVGCEACHGPARAHAANPADGPKPPRSPATSVCLGCHDGKQDGGRFVEADYRLKVHHQPTPHAPPG